MTEKNLEKRFGELQDKIDDFIVENETLQNALDYAITIIVESNKEYFSAETGKCDFEILEKIEKELPGFFIEDYFELSESFDSVMGDAKEKVQEVIKQYLKAKDELLNSVPIDESEVE